MSKLSHIDAQNRPTMVDVSEKVATERQAHARARVRLPADIAAHISGDEIETKKGPVFATAIIAGVMAAKKTYELIPFCHPLGLDNCKVAIELQDTDVVIDCICKVHHKTGVEMEALTAASVALLTVYDMVKAVDRGMVIEGIRLLMKTGGSRGDWEAGETVTRAG